MEFKWDFSGFRLMEKEGDDISREEHDVVESMDPRKAKSLWGMVTTGICVRDEGRNMG